MDARRARRGMTLALAASIAVATGLAAQALADVPCETPPPTHCGERCTRDQLADRGNAVDPDTGRRFFLDFPCDLAPGEDVVFILSLHGGSSIGNWQRHYFPALDFVNQYRLVIATPTAEGSGAIGGGDGVRRHGGSCPAACPVSAHTITAAAAACITIRMPTPAGVAPGNMGAAPSVRSHRSGANDSRSTTSAIQR